MFGSFFRKMQLVCIYARHMFVGVNSSRIHLRNGMFAHHNVFNSSNDWRYMCRRHNRSCGSRFSVASVLAQAAGSASTRTLFCGVGLRFNGRHNTNCCFDDFFNGFCRSFLFFDLDSRSFNSGRCRSRSWFFSLRLNLDGFDGCRNVLFFNRFYCFFNSCRSLNGLSTSFIL